MALLNDDRWVTEKWNEHWKFLSDADERGQRMERQQKDLIAAHRDGWKLVADALGGGLKLIAEAIREHGRR